MELHNRYTSAKLNLVFAAILFFGNCHPKQSFKEISFKGIRLNVSSEATLYKVDGIDSEVGKIVYNRDTFFLEYGEHIYKLEESLPTVLPIIERGNIEKLAGKEIGITENAIFSLYPETDREERIFAKNYYMYDTIGGTLIKIVQPKRIGDGITGMYIPKLKDGKSFSIYAMNLDSSSHKHAIDMFKTFKYKQQSPGNVSE